MTLPAWLLLLEAIIACSLVFGLHSIRRKTSLVLSFATLTFMAFASWAAPHQAAISVGPLDFYVESNVFFSAGLLNVFLLYVADGPRAGRMGLLTVIGTGLAYTLLALLLHLQFPESRVSGTLFPSASLQSGFASIMATLVNLVMLGIVWESLQRGRMKLPLGLRVFLTLLFVFVIDSLVYIPLAWGGNPNFWSMLQGSVVSRTVLSLAYAPLVTAYLNYEVSRHGLKLSGRPIFSILAREDLERELLATRHSLQVGTEALWESEERFRNMVNDLPTMVFRFSLDGTLTFANHATCQYYSLEPEEMIGRSVLVPIDRWERKRVWAQALGLSPAEPKTEIITHAYPAPGKRRLQRWIVRAIFAKDGSGLAYQAVGEDITDKARTEERVVRLATALEHAREYVAITDKTGLLTYSNPALEWAAPDSGDSLVGTSIFELVTGQGKNECVKAIQKSMKQGETWSGRVTMKGEGKAQLVVHATVTPLARTSRSEAGYVMVAHDLTEELAMQQRLGEVDKGEALSRLAAGVAHDFNNLIAVIWGCTEAASAELLERGGPDCPGALSALEDIRQSADQAAELARQLMQVGRQQRLSPVDVNLTETVERMQPLLRRLLPSSVALRCQLSQDNVSAHLDPSELERILVNLVSNAVDATPEGGSIQIETALRTVGTKSPEAQAGLPSGEYATLSVSDTGAGVEPELIQRVFEPFFTTKETDRGTGLGLAAVNATVKAAGGLVRLESSSGKGARFEVLLPKVEEQPPPSQLGRGSKVLVMYCESDAGLRRHMSVALQLAGYDVEAASNVSELLKNASKQRRRRRVLLLDTVATGSTGGSATEEVRQKFPDVPVVLIARRLPDAPSQRVPGENSRGTPVLLQKPFDRSDLLAAVDQALLE